MDGGTYRKSQTYEKIVESKGPDPHASQGIRSPSSGYRSTRLDIPKYRRRIMVRTCVSYDVLIKNQNVNHNSNSTLPHCAKNPLRGEMHHAKAWRTAAARLCQSCRQGILLELRLTGGIIWSRLRKSACQ